MVDRLWVLGRTAIAVFRILRWNGKLSIWNVQELYLERAGFEGSNADVHVCSFIQGANWPDPFPDYTGALFSTVDDDEWGTLITSLSLHCTF